MRPSVERAVEHAHRADHAAVRVVVRVEDQRLQRRVGVALGRRDALDDRVEQLGDALAGLGRDAQDRPRPGCRARARSPRTTRSGSAAGQVDLVHRGDDREVVLEREVAVGQRLGLDALARVDERGSRPRTRPGCARPRSRSRRGPGVSIRLMTWSFQSSRTFWALIVMPRSRSMSIESRYWARMSRVSTAPVSSRIRSASVDLPVVDVGDDRRCSAGGRGVGHAAAFSLARRPRPRTAIGPESGPSC